MKTKRLSALALLLAAFTVCATPALANPGNGNGNGHGNSGNHGNGHGNNGKSADHNAKHNDNASGRKNYGKPDHVESDISFSRALMASPAMSRCRRGSPKTWRAANRCRRASPKNPYRPVC